MVLGGYRGVVYDRDVNGGPASVIQTKATVASAGCVSGSAAGGRPQRHHLRFTRLLTDMYLYSDLEEMARSGGYRGTRNGIFRITAPDVQSLQAGLARSSHADNQSISTVMAQLRRWIVHGDNRPPPVRGAGFVRSDGEVWMAYTDYDSPAIVRGRVSQFEDLRMYLPTTLRQEYDGSLGVRTKPPINLRVDEMLILESPLGSVAIDETDASSIEHWLSASLRRGDRLGVLCLPGAWQPDVQQAQAAARNSDAARNDHADVAPAQLRVVQADPTGVAQSASAPEQHLN